MSLVDLNRSGVALMEIVSKPDLRSAEEAKAYVTKLRTILRYLGTCDGDMEKGSLRADVNVSVRKPGAALGTRCEIKNVNSIRFIGQAIEYEARRQIEILEEGGTIDQETRLFDPDKGETRSMRSKEEAHDYRYFPDPDLLPLEFDAAYVEALKARPAGTAGREEGALHERTTVWRPMTPACWSPSARPPTFSRRVAEGRAMPRSAANWVINELAGRLNKEGKDIAASPVSAAQLGAILDLIGEGTISGKIAKDLFEIVWSEGGDPRAIVEARGMKQVTDLGAIEKVVDEIIAANPDKVARREDQPESDRLVRRPGDESVGRQGQSAGGERPPEEQARPLSGSRPCVAPLARIDRAALRLEQRKFAATTRSDARSVRAEAIADDRRASPMRVIAGAARIARRPICAILIDSASATAFAAVRAKKFSTGRAGAKCAEAAQKMARSERQRARRARRAKPRFVTVTITLISSVFHAMHHSARGRAAVCEKLARACAIDLRNVTRSVRQFARRAYTFR